MRYRSYRRSTSRLSSLNRSSTLLPYSLYRLARSEGESVIQRAFHTTLNGHYPGLPWRSVSQLRRAASKSKSVSARQERRATLGSRPILLRSTRPQPSSHVASAPPSTFHPNSSIPITRNFESYPLAA
ncbi:hypothetical protein RB195_004733 [Necator americanus]|uniref:Uncharacterized protein n=1 Tax=Necator americanus TaxID=51031 RepID=A0ABR1BMQ6_NECAM